MYPNQVVTLTIVYKIKQGFDYGITSKCPILAPKMADCTQHKFSYVGLFLSYLGILGGGTCCTLRQYGL